jgi:hypothetical protein
MSKSMRDSMPVTAQWVDLLRLWLGREAADALIKRSVKGEGTRALGSFYVAELTEAGELLEFGSTVDGRRAVVVDGRPVLP